MRILVTGAYGLIGSAILARLQRDGHNLIGAARSIEAAQQSTPYARWIAADFNHLTGAEHWLPLLAGIDAVVNCVGVFQDGLRDDTRRVHVTATQALFAACKQAGVRRVIHVSASGADPVGPTPFARSKGEADAALAKSDLDWVILRPAVVLAPVAYGASAMFRGLAGLPLVTPLAHGDRPIQIVSIEDLADTVGFCMTPDAPARVIWDLAHPGSYQLADIIVAIRRRLGWRPLPMIELPRPVERCVTVLADALGWLGWRSPARSTAAAQLASGMTGDPRSWMEATAIAPKGLDATLRAWPVGVQERWFARLYWLKPLAIASLAMFWIVTGLIALGPSRVDATLLLVGAGLSPPVSSAITVWGAVFDIVVGAALLVRATARPALIAMFVATLGYIVAATILLPALWLDPLGPWTKTVPVLLVTLFVLAIIEER